MGKKAKAKQGSPKKPKQETPADPLIEPSLLKISELVQSGKLTPEEMAKPFTWTWSSRVPPDLVPFLESPSMPKLVEVLKAYPRLYWHPRVYKQVTYLLRLRQERRIDALYAGASWDDVAAVDEKLKELVAAHASAILPRDSIVWKPVKRGGRPSQYSYPTDWGKQAITGSLLLPDYEALLRELSKHDLTIQKSEQEQDSLERIGGYVQAAYEKLERLSSDFDEDGEPYYKRLDEMADLEELITGVCLDRTVKIGNKERKMWSAASYLAYGVLGLHYRLSLEVVRGLIEREKRKRKKTPPA